MYLFFDTETTGLPRNWKSPVTDLNNWPRLVQLAFLYYDKEGGLIASGNHIILPEGFIIPKETAKIHGITTERAAREGVQLSRVLNQFNEFVTTANYLVAHNMNFDEKIVGCEFLRNKMPNSITAKRKICTMHSTTEFCNIPGNYGPKWPKLSELHFKLFQKNFEEAHDASVDIRATAKCFWELKKRGMLKVQNV